MRSLLLAIGVPLVLVTAGCHHEKKAVVPPTATNLAEAAAPPSQPAPRPPGARKCKVDLDCGERQLCVGGVCTNIRPGLAECQVVRVHFGYDVADIQERDRPGLQRVARCLKADQELLVRVEGNADERGTTEYNLALGDKRAAAVARYLEALGVTRAQLKTVSYGEEKPLCTAPEEACWSKNRRAAVKPQLTAAKGRGLE